MSVRLLGAEVVVVEVQAPGGRPIDECGHVRCRLDRGAPERGGARAGGCRRDRPKGADYVGLLSAEGTAHGIDKASLRGPESDVADLVVNHLRCEGGQPAYDVVSDIGLSGTSLHLEHLVMLRVRCRIASRQA